MRISSGTLSFTRWTKSSGGDAVIHLGNGNTLRLTCGGVLSDAACFDKQVDGVWKNLESELTGKPAIAWWYPEEGKEDFGRLYQLKVGDEFIFRYEEQIEWYMKDYKGGRPFELLAAIVMLIVTVLYARRDLKKRA